MGVDGGLCDGPTGETTRWADGGIHTISDGGDNVANRGQQDYATQPTGDNMSNGGRRFKNVEMQLSQRGTRGHNAAGQGGWRAVEWDV
jgi:hypothetical protein